MDELAIDDAVVAIGPHRGRVNARGGLSRDAVDASSHQHAHTKAHPPHTIALS